MSSKLNSLPSSEGSPALTEPVKKRKRGRPPMKKATEGVTESTIELTLNNSASDNSAAVVRQGICSTPLMRISPDRRRLSTSSTGSVGTTSSNNTPKKTFSAKKQTTPKDLTTIRESKDKNNPVDNLSKAHLELNTITQGNDSKFDNINNPDKSKLKLASSPLYSVSSHSSNSSPFVDASSSPLKTSPVSIINFGDSRKLNYQGATKQTLSSYNNFLLQSSPVLITRSIDGLTHEENEGPSSTAMFSEGATPSAPKTPNSKSFSTNTFLSPNKFSSLDANAYKLQPPSTPTSHFSSVVNSSPMYTLWYQQTPVTRPPSSSNAKGSARKRQAVNTMTTIFPTSLIPKPVGFEDIVSSKELQEVQEGKEIKRKITVQDLKKNSKLESIVAKINEKFPKSDLPDLESTGNKENLKDESNSTAQQLESSPIKDRPKRQKKQSSRINLLNHYQGEKTSTTTSSNATLYRNSSLSSSSVSPHLPQEPSASMLLSSDCEVSVKIDANGKAQIVTKRSTKPPGLQTPYMEHYQLMQNNQRQRPDNGPTTPNINHMVSYNQHLHTPYYHYHPAFPRHIESPVTPVVGLGVTDHNAHRNQDQQQSLAELNMNMGMVPNLNMNTNGLGLLKAANNVPGLKIGAATDPFVTGISSNFTEFENPILIAQTPSTPFVNQYGANSQFMGHHNIINTPGGVGIISALSSPKEARYEITEKRLLDDIETSKVEHRKLTRHDARFALQALLEEI